MAKKETLEEFIERSAQANIAALVAEGTLDPTDETRMARAIEMARMIKKGGEMRKIARNFTLGNPSAPTAEKPFVGCNEICSLKGIASGSIEGPNDFCKALNHQKGTLYFCSHPSVKPLPSGSLPLCFNYHQDHGNENGVKGVIVGKIKLSR